MYYREVLPASVALHFFLLFQQPPAPCPDAPACRQAALDAAARQDYETFHDLAWRTAQKSKPNDPDVMYLLARAQSLSGRPGDALVMLRRLAQMGVPTDAATNDDFRRVRSLAGWAGLVALIAGAPAPPAAAEPAANPAAVPSPQPARAASSNRRLAPPTAPAELPSPANRAAPAIEPAPVKSATVPPPAPSADTAGGEEAMRLNSATIDPVGLAYDSASKRFVLGDRRDNKLIVADEVFNHVNDLIGAASGGFGRLSAVEIDTRRGDLWVTSSDGDGAAAVHKLQLVSGRVLARLDMPASLLPIEIADFAVLDSGGLILLDAKGGRLIRVKGIAGPFERPVALHVVGASSLAPADGRAFVAHADGLSVVNFQTGRVAPVAPAAGTSITGLRRIRWNKGVLLGIQEQSGTARVIRVRLSSSGQKAVAVEPLDAEATSAGSALTISRDAAYYVAQTPGGAAIRKVTIR